MSEPRKWEVKKNKEESRFEVKRKGFCNCHWGEGSCNEKERREERKKAVKSLYVYSYIWFSSDFLETWTLPDTQQEFTRHLLNASVGKSQWSGPDDSSPKTASIAPPYKKFKWCILHASFPGLLVVTNHFLLCSHTLSYQNYLGTCVFLLFWILSFPRAWSLVHSCLHLSWHHAQGQDVN